MGCVPAAGGSRSLDDASANQAVQSRRSIGKTRGDAQAIAGTVMRGRNANQ